MKKVTFLSLLLILSFGVFAQHMKKTNFNAVKTNASQSLHFTGSESKVDTDTLWNFDETANVTVYGFGPGVWGTWTGHNQYNFDKFAEKFTTPAAGQLNGFLYIPHTAHNTGSGQVVFKVYADNAGVPGTELATKTVNISDITVDVPNDVTLDAPVAVDGVFYVGYEISYATIDTFGVYQTESSATNTFYFTYSGSWTDMPALTGGAITGTNLAIGARVNIVFTEPVAQVAPTEWNAGSVEISTSATSGTFTLTNIGTGTLTVTSATFTGTAFTSTFVPGAVSLGDGGTYDFTFDFNPTTEGAYAETFTIVTNGGTVVINLTGAGTAPITGDMDGGFETNVNDFDLTFTGWTQIDNDGGVSYGIEGVDFTNSGYTGSFIAFNPASTTPALTDMAPHAGNRFGACFNAVTASAPNNDWLITPQSDVLTSTAVVNFYVKTYVDTWGLERYNVYVSTTGTAEGDFVKISAGSYLEAPVEDWTLVSYDLSAYSGQQVYIAIQCVSNDAFVFMVDDIEVLASTGVTENTTKVIGIYPNPTSGLVNITNAKTIVVYNMIGEVVATVNNANALTTIDLSAYGNGSYIVKVNNGKEVMTEKINVIK